jgi:hypothetical protein
MTSATSGANRPERQKRPVRHRSKRLVRQVIDSNALDLLTLESILDPIMNREEFGAICRNLQLFGLLNNVANAARSGQLLEPLKRWAGDQCGKPTEGHDRTANF